MQMFKKELKHKLETFTIFIQEGIVSEGMHLSLKLEVALIRELMNQILTFLA